MQQYINLNGKHYPADEPVLHHTNRGFQYGDALFETMHANGKQVQFFYDHMQRLITAMGMLRMDVPSRIKTHGIEHEIARLLHTNRHLKGARVRLTVFRNSGGKYAPADLSCSWLIETEALESDTYRLNEKGMIIDVFSRLKKPLTPLSNLKTTNDLAYIMAGIHKNEKGLDECLLINSQNEITEAISSNVFLVSGSVIHTPPLASGCLDGIMRKKIIEFSREAGYEVYDRQPLALEHFLHGDEVFLTNAVKGIQWVGGIRKKRYFKGTAKRLMGLLNEKTAID
ncbi:MAG: aminotransferase class IV family protein [Bacteroidales bacterium]|nr:aminotransferase class IV family protein [Bacteroidales bacterium]